MTQVPREPDPLPASPPHPPPSVPAAGDPAAKPAAELTPEEQMERFARELKEADWGHQPC